MVASNIAGWLSEMRSEFGSLEVIGGCGWWEGSKSQTGQFHGRIAGEVLDGVNKKSSSKVICHKGGRERQNELE